MLDAIMEIGLELLASVAVGVLGLLGAYALYHIGNAKKALQAKTENEYVEAVIDRAFELTVTAVMSTEAQAAKMIRAAMREGRLTSEVGRAELVELGQETIERVKSELGEKAIELLQEQRVDIDALIKDMLENAVEGVKNPLSDGSGHPEQTLT